MLFLTPVFVFSAPPAGVDITLGTCTTTNCISLLDSASSIANFLFTIGWILVGITIVGTGIMYVMAGGNPQKMTSAKSMFKAGIIGALIYYFVVKRK